MQTPSQRGLTGPTATVLNDISSIIDSLLATAASMSVPVFLMGHSMGGAEVLQWAARGPSDMRSQIRGYVAESPYLTLHTSAQPRRMIAIAGRLAAKVLPKRQMVQKLQPRWLCRDPAVCKKWEDDELCHDTGTLEGLAGMMDRGAELNCDRIVVEDEKSFWIGHGSGDRVTSFESSKQWFGRLKAKDKEFKEYPGWFHKLHAEPGEDKITFANDVAGWILARANIQRTQALSEPQSKL